MVTIRARSRAAIGICLLLLMVGCSREQQDWRSAEAADTIEAYDRFVQRHPESELARQAQTRIAQLGEDLDWQRAGSADTVEAYREFMAQHPNGRWSQEARIRIENFSLGEQTAGSAAQPSAAAGPPSAVSASSASGSAANPPSAPSATPVKASTPIPPASGSGPITDLAVVNGPDEARTQRPAANGSAGATPTPVALGVPAEPIKGDFGIQLGAFSTEQGASSQWKVLTGRFTSELQGLQEQIVPADTPSGRIYRLQASVGAEARARAICDSLQKRSQPCVAVLPH